MIRDVVWYSPVPIASELPVSPLTIVTKPGLSEIVEDGVGWQFHKEMANRNPYAKVLTHATEGFGPLARRCSIMDLSAQSLENMAEHGRELLRLYFGDERLAVVGISMGSVILHKLLVADRQATASDKLNVAANVNYAPALVDPKNIARDMLFKFPVLMLVDGGSEIVARTSPQRFLELCEVLAASKPSWRDVPPMARQIIDLLKGVSKEEVHENAEQYTTGTITGELDPVGQIPMWQSTNALLHVIKRRGHGMAVKAREGAIKTTSTLHQLDIYTNPKDPTNPKELRAA
jgi:hypothetical protein